MSFYDRYEKCCKERGIAPKSQFAADCLGCTKSYIISLSKTGNFPTGSIVANAAKMLNVTSDYLLQIIDTPRTIDIEFSEQEIKILSDIKSLNIDAKNAACAMISGLLNTDIYRKKI